MYDLKLDKDEKYIIRLTIGGSHIIYTYDISTPTTELTNVELLLNSVISTSKVKFMTLDTKTVYLSKDIPKYEYICITLTIVPHNIIDQFKLQDIATTDSYIYIYIYIYI